MGVRVRESLAYALADALDMQIGYREIEPRLFGKKETEVDISGVKFPVKAKIISSHFNRDNHMVFVKAAGNLILFLTATDNRGMSPLVELSIINLAKMGMPDGWLEKHQPKDADEAVALLDKAVVKTFKKKGARKWVEIPA